MPVVPAEVWKRLQERYPEEQPADAAGWEKVFGRYVDDSEAEMSRYREAEAQMTELCRVYPEFAAVVHELVENRLPFRAAVVKVFSQEDLIPQEGDEDYEAYRTAYTERLDGLKKREAQTKEIDDNEVKSMETIDRFCEEKSLDDEQKEQLVGVINDHFTELLYKRISPEMLEGFLKQMSYDDAVAEAEKAGLIRGRNEQIEAKRRRERVAADGDGLPGIGGGGRFSRRRRCVGGISSICRNAGGFKSRLKIVRSEGVCGSVRESGRAGGGETEKKKRFYINLKSR